MRTVAHVGQEALTTARCTAEATFERGAATIAVEARRRGGPWRITVFQVLPKALAVG